MPLDKEGNKTIIERLVWNFDIDINQRYFLPSNMKNLEDSKKLPGEIFIEIRREV